MKPEDINKKLAQTRDQKFRKVTEAWLDGKRVQAIKMKEWHQTVATSDYYKKATQASRNVSGTGYEYILRSPGKELLDIYDEEWRLLTQRKSNAPEIPPSLVYKIRYELKLPAPKGRPKLGETSAKEIMQELCKDYKQTNDQTYWMQILKRRYGWLTNTPSKEYRFDYIADMDKLIKNITNKKSKRMTGFKPGERYMYWAGAMAGWLLEIREASAVAQTR
jgi:hypothetical protein